MRQDHQANLESPDNLVPVEPWELLDHLVRMEILDQKDSRETEVHADDQDESVELDCLAERDLVARRDLMALLVSRDHLDFQETQDFPDQLDFQESKDPKVHQDLMEGPARKATKASEVQMAVQEPLEDQDQTDQTV